MRANFRYAAQHKRAFKRKLFFSNAPTNVHETSSVLRYRHAARPGWRWKIVSCQANRPCHMRNNRYSVDRNLAENAMTWLWATRLGSLWDRLRTT